MDEAEKEIIESLVSITTQIEGIYARLETLKSLEERLEVLEKSKGGPTILTPVISGLVGLAPFVEAMVRHHFHVYK